MFVGFVFAMVLGHAPIILPAVLHVAVSFTRVLYAPLAVLHIGLVLRIAGDLLIWEPGRLWGGLIDALAILGFVGIVAASALIRQAPAEIHRRNGSMASGSSSATHGRRE